MLREITSEKCIYCQDNIGESREHIIPNALLERLPNSAWIIQKGSCKVCQKIINVYETDVIRSLFKGIRPVVGIKKDKVEIFSIFDNSIYSPDAYLTTNVIFEIPQTLPNSKIFNGKIRIREFYSNLYDPNSLMNGLLENGQLGENLLGEESFSPGNLMKMLAKIAYGFAVLQFGESFYSKSKLPQIILNKKNHELGKYVGSLIKSELEVILNNSSLLNQFNTSYHSVEIRLYDNKLISIISLFNNHGFNTKDSYIVILAEV
jgi:hypothetical protein